MVSSKDIVEFGFRFKGGKSGSVWLLEEAISKFNLILYKNALIGEISDLLSSGVDPSNLVVTNREFNINDFTRNLGEIDLQFGGIKHFLSLGNITALAPSPHTSLLDAAISYHNRALFLSWDHRFEQLRWNIFNDTFRGGAFPSAKVSFNHLHSTSLEYLKGMLRESVYEHVSDALTDQHSKSSKELVDREDLPPSEEALDEASSTFFTTFIRNKKPVVMQINPDLHNARVLCPEYLPQDEKLEGGIDIISVEHRNPYEGIVKGMLGAFLDYDIRKDVSDSEIKVNESEARLNDSKAEMIVDENQRRQETHQLDLQIRLEKLAELKRKREERDNNQLPYDVEHDDLVNRVLKADNAYHKPKLLDAVEAVQREADQLEDKLEFSLSPGGKLDVKS